MHKKKNYRFNVQKQKKNSRYIYSNCSPTSEVHAALTLLFPAHLYSDHFISLELLFVFLSNSLNYIPEKTAIMSRQEFLFCLKIKATASKARENVSALRWLFFFAVVRQNEVIFFTYILYGKFVDFIKIWKNNERYRSIALSFLNMEF